MEKEERNADLRTFCLHMPFAWFLRMLWSPGLCQAVATSGSFFSLFSPHSLPENEFNLWSCCFPFEERCDLNAFSPWSPSLQFSRKKKMRAGNHICGDAGTSLGMHGTAPRQRCEAWLRSNWKLMTAHQCLCAGAVFSSFSENEKERQGELHLHRFLMNLGLTIFQ